MHALRLGNRLDMAQRLSRRIKFADIVLHLLLHLVKPLFALVIADGLVRVNLPIPRHWRPLDGIRVRDGEPLLLHELRERFGDLLCLIVAPGVGVGPERSYHLIDPVIGRRFAVGVELGNGLGANILGLRHDRFERIRLFPALEDLVIEKVALEARLVELGAEDLQVRALADVSPVNLVKIGHIHELRFLALGRLDDFAVFVALRLFLDPADFPDEGLHVADDAGLGAAGRHARVGEAVGVDFQPVQLVEEEGLVFPGHLVSRDAGGEEDRQKQKWEHDSFFGFYQRRKTGRKKYARMQCPERNYKRRSPREVRAGGRLRPDLLTLLSCRLQGLLNKDPASQDLTLRASCSIKGWGPRIKRLYESDCNDSIVPV